MTWNLNLTEIKKFYGPDIAVGDVLGFLPEIIRPEDERPAALQIAERYAHGGGWRPSGEGEYQWDGGTGKLSYPGDPAMFPLASLVLPLSGELVVLYPYGMVLVCDGTVFQVSRMD